MLGGERSLAHCGPGFNLIGLLRGMQGQSMVAYCGSRIGWGFNLGPIFALTLDLSFFIVSLL